MDRPGLSRTLLRGQLLTDWRVILHDQLTMIVIIIIIQKSLHSLSVVTHVM